MMKALYIKEDLVRQRKRTHTARRINLRAAAEDPDRTTKGEENTKNATEIYTIPHHTHQHASRHNKMALHFLTVPCMVVMMMMTVARAAPSKPHGKVSTHHKPSSSSEEDSPKYFIITNLESEIRSTSHSIRPIHNDSISPWEYITSTDQNRIPPQLSEARCLLTGCLNWNGVETLELESRRIFRQIPVLQRVRGDEKNYFYRLEYKIISVGCTCVRPYVEQI